MQIPLDTETQARKVTTDELEDLLRATGVLRFETTEQVKAYKKMGIRHKLPDDLKDPEAFLGYRKNNLTI